MDWAEFLHRLFVKNTVNNYYNKELLESDEPLPELDHRLLEQYFRTIGQWKRAPRLPVSYKKKATKQWEERRKRNTESARNWRKRHYVPPKKRESKKELYILEKEYVELINQKMQLKKQLRELVDEYHNHERCNSERRRSSRIAARFHSIRS